MGEAKLTSKYVHIRTPFIQKISSHLVFLRTGLETPPALYGNTYIFFCLSSQLSFVFHPSPFDMSRMCRETQFLGHTSMCEITELIFTAATCWFALPLAWKGKTLMWNVASRLGPEPLKQIFKWAWFCVVFLHLENNLTNWNFLCGIVTFLNSRVLTSPCQLLEVG